MTITLEEVITTPNSGRTRAVVLDFHDYAQSVILQGRDVPWHQPTAYSNFFGQAQAFSNRMWRCSTWARCTPMPWPPTTD